MGPTLLLGATLLLGQVQEMPRFSRPFSPGWAPPALEGRRPALRLGERMGGLFGRRHEAPPNHNWQAVPMPVPADALPFSAAEATPVPETPPRRLPSRVALTADGSITIEAVDPDLLEPELRPAAFGKSRVDARFVSRLSRSDDYASITGQLHIHRGVHELHYSVAGDDRHGGMLILEMHGDLSPLQNGDLVHVHGSLHQRESGEAVYRPQVIQILERR